MARDRSTISDNYDDPDGMRSIYDPAGADAPGLMPGPGPREPVTNLADPAPWRAAQSADAVALAEAAQALGQLDAVVAQMGDGATLRLALREVSALSWMTGAPLSVDEIGRDRLQAKAGTDVQALRQARWALRRLTGDGSLSDLRAFLGLHRSDQSELAGGARLRMTGTLFDESAAAFLNGVARLDGAHPLTRGAYARHLWQLLDLSPAEDQAEAAVWAARHMATGCEALRFAPLGHGMRQLAGTGPARLGVFFAALAQGATQGRTELLQLQAWQARALDRVARIKGNNPARIIAALMARPIASTEMIETATGVSRDTAERLLARLHDMGLVREVTGARRFRIWAAAVV